MDKLGTASFIGDAEAILSVSEDADNGIYDLVDSYKSNEWENPDEVLELVKSYAQKMREKSPGPQNQLTAEETFRIAPVKPDDVGNVIQTWEEANKSILPDTKDPLIKAYEDQIEDAITNAATVSIQQANNETVSEGWDKAVRLAYGYGPVPGLAKLFGVEKDLVRQLRADSNDTLSSAVASGVGSLLSLPVLPATLVANPIGFGVEQYEQSRKVGSSRLESATSAGIEALNQVLDVFLDKTVLGGKLLHNSGKAIEVAARAGGGALSEFANQKVSQIADFVGLNPEEFGPLVSEQDKIALAAGGIVGGASPILFPGMRPEDTTNPQDLSFLNSFATDTEITPPLDLAVIGEAVKDSTNLTTVKDAGEGTPTGQEILKNDDGTESIVLNPDGTSSRIVNGEEKQAHANGIKISDEVAQKLAFLQSQMPADEAVVIRYDDLGNAYVKHPKIAQDLTYNPEGTVAEPVMIPQSDTGHTLQFSKTMDAFGNNQYSASISKTSMGAMAFDPKINPESAIANKIRAGNFVNDNVKEILALDLDFASALTYTPTTNDVNREKINRVFERYNNNMMAFADDIMDLDSTSLSPEETVAAAIVSGQLSDRSDYLRSQGATDLADKYDLVSANMLRLSQIGRTETAQALQMGNLIPWRGSMITGAIRAQTRDIAAAKVAKDLKLSYNDVIAVDRDNSQIRKVEVGLSEREAVLNEEQTKAQELHDAPIKKVEELQKQIDALKAPPTKEGEPPKKPTATEKETIKRLSEQLKAAKEESKRSAKERKESLKETIERLKTERQKLSEDKEKLQARKDKNKEIQNKIDKYTREYRERLTPEVSAKITKLVDIANKQKGHVKQLALEEIGKTISEVKGVPYTPGSDPLSTFWQSNVLSSIGTNVSNITGNLLNPVGQVLSDLGNREGSKAYRFARGALKALFSSQTKRDIIEGLKGELPSRATDLEGTAEKLKLGVGGFKETDAVRNLQLLFGTGKLGKLLSAPGISLRALGAMDAVFYHVNKEGYLAREALSYKSYLDAKSADYDLYRQQAEAEATELKSLGVNIPKGFINRRADELSFLNKPEALQTSINKRTRKAIFQEEGGAKGALGHFSSRLLNAAGNVTVGTYTKNVNTISPLKKLAHAVSFSNTSIREKSVDELFHIVSEGIGSGKKLIINGTEVEGNLSIKRILSEVVDATTKNQIISLRGEGVRPLKYVLGMFVNTGSQVLDMSMAHFPGIGIIDRALSGALKNATPEERAEFYGTQIASTAITAGMLAATFSNFDDEEHAGLYVYGGMLDRSLRDYYKNKGINPYTLRIGSYTLNYKDIPGINLVLAGIGSMADAAMVAKRDPTKPFTIGSALQAAAIGSAYAATQLTLFKNLATFADIIQAVSTGQVSDKSAFDTLSNIAAGFVPLSGAQRELERFIYGDLSRPRDLSSRMIQNLPMTKHFTDNKPALNLFGKPTMEPFSFERIPGLGRFVGTTEPSPELDWVLRNGYKVTFPQQGTTRLTEKEATKYKNIIQSDDPDNFEPYLTEEDHYRYMKKVGPELQSILLEESLKNPNGYSKTIQDRVNERFKKAKARAKNEIIRGRY